VDRANRAFSLALRFLHNVSAYQTISTRLTTEAQSLADNIRANLNIDGGLSA
jgi:hypothetical protein